MLLHRLIYLRNNFSLTQEDVANLLGVARTTYAMYEQGHREMDYASLIKLADRYRISLDYLFGRTDNPIQSDGMPTDEVEYMIKSLQLYRSMKMKILRQ